ncbi:unnamed protein product [Diamesa hyperborea]
MGKKKLSKKEKARLEAEQAETLRIEMEKERLKKLEEDRERKMRERRDAKKKQEQEAVENKLRRVQLRQSSHVFKKSKEEIKHLMADEKLKTEWEQYMRCNGLPNANDPSDLRKYIHMWLDDVKKLNNKEINWLLKTNEQSILTQDQSVPDLSKANLKKIQPHLGEMYAKRVGVVLGILEEMDGIICDKYSLSANKMEDLLDLKHEFRTVLASFIDELSFKILSNIERDMTLTGLVQATHKFESPVFKTELYALRSSVPLPPPANPKDKLKEERTNIDFSTIMVSLVLPPTVKCNSAAIRGLWLTYDHMSDYCHSFIFCYDNSDRKKLTLRQTTKREWKKRKELLQKALFQIFNEKPEETADDSVAQPRVIDVDKMYTEYEDELNKIERAKMSLKLYEFEVNLRSHRITGGILEIEYLEQPLQNVKTDEGALLRTLIHPIKLKKKHYHQAYRAPKAPKPGVRRLPEEIELEIRLMEENMEKLVLVNVELPDNVSWFEPPIVCRWETDEEFNEMRSIDEEEQKKNKNPEEEEKVVEKNKKEKIIRKPAKERKIKIVEDFNLLEVPGKTNLQPLFDEFVIPMLPDGYEIKFEQKKSNGYDKNIFKDNKIYTIEDIVFQTRSARALFPNTCTRTILKVVKDRSKYIDMSPGEYSSDEENDESMYSAESDQIGPKTNLYLFSKFMRDLEDLIEMEQPSFEKKIAEMSSNFSMASEMNSPTGFDRQNSGISLTKTNSKSLLDISSPSDSEAESETDNEEEDEENIGNAMVDATVKQANINRCSGRWSTRDIHDVKFNEDKLTIQFRTGRLGIFGFASSRSSNFPFQSWELKPEFKIPGTVVFTLTASVIGMEVVVSERGLTLNSLQGIAPTVLQNAIGATMSLNDLIKTMRNAACDIFPDDDGFCYTENSCEKNHVMENHIYESISCFALSHNFAWSRWNVGSGSRTSVFLMRELIEHRKLPNQSTVHVTPFKASIIDCTEVSPVYNSVPVQGMEYFADLYHLAMSNIQLVSKSKKDSMSPILRQNIIQLFRATRPLSFC